MTDFPGTLRPNTVLLHIGPHKTGTTAIQRTLAANSQALADHGLVYPEVGLNDDAHHDLGLMLERGEEARLEEMAALLSEQRGRAIVLSSESFSSLAPPAIQRLQQMLAGFDEVRVVTYLRNFLEMPYAWWQEQVKHREADMLNDFMLEISRRPSAAHILNYGRMIRTFSAAFDNNIRIYIYDRVMAAHGDVAVHFMNKVLGVADYDRVVGNVNQSLDPVATEILRCLNRSGVPGIRMMFDNPAVRALSDDVGKRSAGYLKNIRMAYDQQVFRQVECDLIMTLADLELEYDDMVPNQVFQKREHESAYLDPSIWLFEPDLAAQMRALVEACAAAPPPRTAAVSVPIEPEPAAAPEVDRGPPEHPAESPAQTTSERIGAFYQDTDREVIDYHEVPLPGTIMLVRAPLPKNLETGGFVCAIGAAQTFGRFVERPYLRLLGEHLGIETLNLGSAGAGPGFYAARGKAIDVMNRAQLVIVQVMSGRSVSNSYFENTNAGSLRPWHAPKSEKPQHAIAAWDAALAEKGAAFMRDLVAETRRNYIAEMKQLMGWIRPPKLLFWFSQRTPDYQEAYGSAGAIFGEFPQLINRAVLDKLRPHAQFYAECISSRGMPQPTISRFTGKMVDLGVAPQNPGHNAYYPSPQMHEDAAAALAPVVTAALSRIADAP